VIPPKALEDIQGILSICGNLDHAHILHEKRGIQTPANC